MRVVYEFGKIGRLRFISHLDLQRFMMRALRRTSLPVAYSQGFNPHPQMSFASALAMGWLSDVELMDIKLTAPVDADDALAQMRRALPPEMPVHRCRLIDDRHPALMASLVMADYDVSITGDTAAFASAMAEFLAQEDVRAVRKTKSGEKEVNIRPLVRQLSMLGNTVSARLMLTAEETLKPDLLIETIASQAGLADVAVTVIRRTALLGLGEQGEPTPLMEL